MTRVNDEEFGCKRDENPVKNYTYIEREDGWSFKRLCIIAYLYDTNNDSRAQAYLLRWGSRGRRLSIIRRQVFLRLQRARLPAPALTHTELIRRACETRERGTRRGRTRDREVCKYRRAGITVWLGGRRHDSRSGTGVRCVLGGKRSATARGCTGAAGPSRRTDATSSA